ncbi:cysteine hydrolase [Xanthomonas sp. NCPPB 1067]|uniref:cysteine hydrolase family protein n=1 Tax=Xanthomonas sp. NCPPB 1067 TaxID=487524 RepID=UPI001E54FACD|nr:cysteine hydrolase family protein [Xanthomonas sp. NCPPB 1067]MCC4589370.1 cysteine hydrolase [Xanthomonas sp. NCPPB 1067]
MNKCIIVIDLQNDYLPSGKLPLSGIASASSNAALVLDNARSSGIPVFHVRHEATDANAAVFVAGSHGAETQSAVAPLADEPVIVKHHVNAFRDTDLQPVLQQHGITDVVIVGAMSHMCVDACVRAAADLGYSVTVLHDACATMDLTFDGVTAPAAQVHAAMMAAFQFGYAAVHSTQEYLQHA